MCSSTHPDALTTAIWTAHDLCFGPGQWLIGVLDAGNSSSLIVYACKDALYLGYLCFSSNCILAHEKLQEPK